MKIRARLLTALVLVGTLLGVATAQNQTAQPTGRMAEIPEISGEINPSTAADSQAQAKPATRATRCGDGFCTIGEDSTVCPYDCAPAIGTCGPANGATRASVPFDTDACASGVAVFDDGLADDGTYNWYCDGAAGDSPACVAMRSIAPSCGAANGGSATSYPSGSAACATGTQQNVDTVGSDGNFNWQCLGVNDPGSVNCAATNTGQPPVCKAYGTTQSSQPAVNDASACDRGVYADTADTGTTWNWTCGNTATGATAACTAPKPAAPPPTGNCGPASDVPTTSYPSSGHCSAGNRVNNDQNGNDGEYNWTCRVSFSNQTACSAPRIQNGTCGSANGTTRTSAPGSNEACSAGSLNFSDNVGGDGDYNWTCAGTGGGTTPSCAALRRSNGVCQTYNAQAGYAAQPASDTSNGCLVGTYADVGGEGVASPWAWTCSGINGGSTSNCTANKLSCPSQTYNWSVAGLNCSATGALVRSGLTRVVQDGDGAEIGEVTVSCSNGTPSLSNPSCRAPRNCTSSNVSWSTGAAACSASISATSHGSSRNVSDNSGTDTGSAQFSCFDGSYGQNSGSCSTTTTTPPPGDGACGSANNVPTASYPASGHCSSGSTSATDTVGSDNSFNWTCSGTNGGASASCSAPKDAAPSGCTTSCPAQTMNGHSLPSACAGTERAFTCQESSCGTNCREFNDFYYTCGANGSWALTSVEESTSCGSAPVPGSCGSANNVPTASYPASGHCSSGSTSATDTVGSDNSFNWTCSGTNGGAPASCSAPKDAAPSGCTTSCAARTNSDGHTLPSACAGAEHDYCHTGQTKEFVCQSSGSWQIVNTEATSGCPDSLHSGTSGSCGPAADVPTDTYPTSGHCSSGTKSDVDTVGSDGSYNWGCNGSGGGSSASCSATKPTPPSGSRACEPGWGSPTSWTVNNRTCCDKRVAASNTVQFTAMPHGGQKTLPDTRGLTSGRIDFFCNDGQITIETACGSTNECCLSGAGANCGQNQ